MQLKNAYVALRGPNLTKYCLVVKFEEVVRMLHRAEVDLTCESEYGLQQCQLSLSQLSCLLHCVEVRSGTIWPDRCYTLAVCRRETLSFGNLCYTGAYE
jgi:hypothetical protein